MDSPERRQNDRPASQLIPEAISHSTLSRRGFMSKSALLGLSASFAPRFVAGAQSSTPPAGDERFGGVFDHYTPQTIGRIDPLTTQANYLTLLAINTF